MPRPIVAKFSPSAMRNNVAVAKRQCPDAKVLPVLKANAYGHGLERSYRAIADVADGIAVIEVEAAVALRRDLGCTKVVALLQGFFEPSDLPLMEEYQITCGIHSKWQVELLLASGAKFPIFLKFNTGMNRLGFTADDIGYLEGVLPMLKEQCPSVGLMTHFAEASSDIAWQVEAFEATVPAHWRDGSMEMMFANSAAIMNHKGGPKANWVRPGIMTYGSSPLYPAKTADELGLVPVITLEAKVIAVQTVSPGATVGYNRAYEVSGQPMRVGVVACGYADGYPRHAPSGTPVLIDGVASQTVGIVSMDMLMVDLTPVPGADVGAVVTLWGKGLSPDVVATAAQTIAYELFTKITARVPFEEVE